MSNEAIRAKAIAARHLLAQKIVIHTDADFTPTGKRVARVVSLSSNPFNRYAVAKGVRAIRWYVGGRIYRTMALNSDSVAMTDQWQ